MSITKHFTRGVTYQGTITEKHTVVDLVTGRSKRLLVVRRDDEDGSYEDWFFVSETVWNAAHIEDFGGDCVVQYGLGKKTKILKK